MKKCFFTVFMVLMPTVSLYTIASADCGKLSGLLGSNALIENPIFTRTTEKFTLFDKDVLVDEQSIGPVESYTFEGVIEDHSISAIFEKSTVFVPETGDNFTSGFWLGIGIFSLATMLFILLLLRGRESN